MKKLISILVLLTTLSTFAIDNQEYYFEQYNKGNKAYENADYEGAINSFQSIVEAGYSSPEVYYNLGNCFYKLGQLPNSILYFEKALKIRPDDKDIAHNLSIANSMITDRVEPLPETIFSKIGTAVLSTFSIDGWAWVAVVIIFLASLSFFIYRTSNKISIKKIFFFNAILLTGFFTFSILFAEIQRNKTLNEEFAIVFSPTVNLLSEPKSGSTKLYVIHEGLKVQIIENQDNWIKVSLADGNIGWIKNSDIIKI